MTFDSGRLERRARRRRRRVPWKLLGLIVVCVCLFGVGLALGEALHDNPKPGGTRTTQRTLKPLPLTPATVTVSRSR